MAHIEVYEKVQGPFTTHSLPTQSIHVVVAVKFLAQKDKLPDDTDIASISFCHFIHVRVCPNGRAEAWEDSCGSVVGVLRSGAWEVKRVIITVRICSSHL